MLDMQLLCCDVLHALHQAELSCAVLCCAVLCCAALCCAVLCCAVLCCFLQTGLHAVLRYVVLLSANSNP